MRALAKDPDSRFVNADAFLKVARRSRAGARRAPPGGHRRVRGRRSRWHARPSTEEGEEWEGYEERRARPWWHWALIALLVAAVAAGIAWLLTGSDLFKSEKDVPAVTGQEVGVATELLESQGFDVDMRPARTPPRATPSPNRTAIAGETVDEGSTIVLTVSSGPSIVQVPNVTGLSEKAGDETASRRRAFEVTTTFRADETVPEDRVVGTEPGDGHLPGGGRHGHPHRSRRAATGRGPERGRTHPTSRRCRP